MMVGNENWSTFIGPHCKVQSPSSSKSSLYCGEWAIPCLIRVWLMIDKLYKSEGINLHYFPFRRGKHNVQNWTKMCNNPLVKPDLVHMTADNDILRTAIKSKSQNYKWWWIWGSIYVTWLEINLFANPSQSLGKLTTIRSARIVSSAAKFSRNW